MMSETFERLASWYAKQCNGEWEHEFGVTIETLDNPGWSVTIDLTGTDAAELDIPRLDEKISDADWIVCYGDGSHFYGTGDPYKLGEILQYFVTLANQRENA